MTASSDRDAQDQFLRERHRPAHARRRADRWAAFLLPHLRPGMRLLDVGCGPASITAGLATAVSPGLTVGVDFDPARTEGTTINVAAARGEQLPFADASFDAVVALADADWDGYLVHPSDPLLERGQEVLRALRSTGDPTVGKRLRDLLAANGLVDAVATATTSSDGGAGTEAAGGFRAASFEAPSAVALAESLGVSTATEMATIADAWRRWGASPGAFFAGFWVEALAWVPADAAGHR